MKRRYVKDLTARFAMPRGACKCESPLTMTFTFDFQQAQIACQALLLSQPLISTASYCPRRMMSAISGVSNPANLPCPDGLATFRRKECGYSVSNRSEERRVGKECRGPW